jgi:hypothetical protein
MRRRDGPLIAAFCAVTAVLVVLAAHVPDDTFVGGDSGVKLVAVRNAITYPTRPLPIAPPVVNGVPLLSMMDPFFVPHADHADAVTTIAFPLMTAPFYRLFGLRGLYVLPLIGLLAALLALVATARSLGWTHAGAAVFLLLLTLTPLLFYGLEFWEHTCAAALAYAGTAVFFRPARTTRGLLAAGALLGGAIVLRPEAICFVAALPIADRCLASSARPRELLVLFAGVAIAVIPLFAYNLVHFHSLTGLHLGRSVVALDANYLPSHVAIAHEWLSTAGMFPTVVVIAAIAVALVQLRGSLPGDTFVRAGVIAAAVVAVLAARRAFTVDSIWSVFPAGLLVFFSVGSPGGPRALAVLALVDTALVLATTPNDGGAQWGPRYLLLATGPAALSVCWMLADVWRRRAWIGIAAAIVLVMACLGVQRYAFKDLRSTKEGYKHLQDLVVDAARDGLVLTDVWWLDQVAGTNGPPPVFLYAPTDRLGDAARRLDEIGVRALLVVTAADDVNAARQIRETTFTVMDERRADSFALTSLSLAKRSTPASGR